jgi:hypothetical protein
MVFFWPSVRIASGGPKKTGVLPTFRVFSSRVSAGATQVGSPRTGFGLFR